MPVLGSYEPSPWSSVCNIGRKGTQQQVTHERRRGARPSEREKSRNGGSGSSRQPIHTKMRRTCHLGEQVGAVGIARTTSAAHFGVAVSVIRIVGSFARHARVGVVRAIAVIIRHLSNLLPVPAQQGGLSMVRQIARGGRATAGAATAGAHPMRAASGLARRSSAPIAEPMIIDMASTATGAVTMSPAGNGCEGGRGKLLSQPPLVSQEIQIPTN